MAIYARIVSKMIFIRMIGSRSYTIPIQNNDSGNAISSINKVIIVVLFVLLTMIAFQIWQTSISIDLSSTNTDSYNLIIRYAGMAGPAHAELSNNSSRKINYILPKSLSLTLLHRRRVIRNSLILLKGCHKISVDVT